MNAAKTILVTGGAGYIGSHTIIELLENTDYNVISIDNYSNSSAKTFLRIEKITGKKVVNYAVDLCDIKSVEAIFEKEKNIIGIIHFAAFKSVPESVNNPYKYYSNNINSLLNILECCLKYKIEHFIFSSSCSVYGNISELPVKETTPLGKAESPYAFTKQIGEEILKDYAKAFPAIKIIALRYFNPVGAHVSGLIGEDPINKPTSLVPVITQTATGKIKQMTVHGTDYSTRDGSCIRDYIHVTDIAIAHIKALEYILNKKQKNNFSIFNLGTGNGVSVLEAIQAFEKITNEKLKYSIGPKRAGDVAAIYSDTTLSEKELGWKTKFTLDEMMETAWKWEQMQTKE
ncbi:MAG: UDP-glucose 4-epimerase GalE [Bacteroidetes bacterium RIFCSPLOWO2_12_FULL_35_15]|nr:MAG: UDP-glucose 4-epimerase GalE [Bacteroidetes bacterium RIFCSPLOWO2_12_FULL_35_15]